eukprot:NODE_470_length_8086_cov_0.567422.p1 type:complete len:689 gc:universal NODE_470_length_8086_cov_0.567422:7902-5836(-)
MKTLKLISWILVWYIFTSLSNIQLKQFLQSNNIFLACFGSLFVSMILLPFYSPKSKYELISDKSKIMSGSRYSKFRPFVQLSLFHLCNALFTCYAFKYSSIQFNYTIKAFEPFISGLLSMYLLNSSLNGKQWLSLCPIPVGVAIATLTDVSFSWSALYVSVASVFVTCCRSVLFKKSELSPFEAFILLSGLSGYGCFFLLMIYSLFFGITLPSNADLVHLFLASVYYFMYNLASFMILNELHAVSHAIANVFKRIISIIYAWIYFQYPVNSMNILGITIAYAGVCLYGIYKPRNASNKKPNSSKSQSVLLNTALLLLASVFILQAYQQDSPLFSKSMRLDESTRLIRRQSCISAVQAQYTGILRDMIPYHQSVVLIDAPDHENVGDSLIWLGEELALSRMGITVDTTCTSTECKDNIDLYDFSNNTILMHGGGNWGDLYRWATELRISYMDKYKKNTLIFLPQSIYYEDEEIMHDDALKFREFGDLHLTVRSNRSKTILDKEFSENLNRYLMPDGAFMLGHVDPSCDPNKDVLYLKRRDEESLSSNKSDHEWLLRESGLIFDIIDWGDLEELENMGELNNPFYNGKPKEQHRLPRYRLDRANRLFCGYKVILTDRLHASILALLMDKPVVCLENNYGKIHGVTSLMEHFGGENCNSNIVRRYYAPGHNMTLAIAQVKKYLAELKELDN